VVVYSFCGQVSVGRTDAARPFESFNQPGQLSGVAFDPAGNRVALGSWDDTVTVLSVATDKAVLELVGHTRGVSGVTYSRKVGTSSRAAPTTPCGFGTPPQVSYCRSTMICPIPMTRRSAQTAVSSPSSTPTIRFASGLCVLTAKIPPPCSLHHAPRRFAADPSRARRSGVVDRLRVLPYS